MKKGIKTILQISIIIVVTLIANISSNSATSLVSSDAGNRVINLTTMALKLEEDINNDLYSAKDTYTGDLTGYAADCALCSGTLSCASSYYVLDGTTTYYDSTYGEVRIVASSKNLPCGTIVRFTSKLSSEPTFAIVLDRGVTGYDLDLLMASETEALTYVGRSTITYDVLRSGWGE